MIVKTDKLFGSRTRVALLNELLMHPSKSFYLSELSKNLGVAFSAVHKEASSLCRLGLVTEEKRGRQRFVKINEESPIYEELKRLFVKTEGLGSVLTAALKKLEGIRFALVYGSFARGDYVESSDVDLLVVGDVKEDELLDAVRKTEVKTGREVNYVLWREKELRRKARTGTSLTENISSNPVIMLVGDENEFRKIVSRTRDSKNIAKQR